MISDRELWACALAVERQYGRGAPLFVAERIGALALVADWGGVTTWRAIAERLDALRPVPGEWEQDDDVARA